MVASNVAHDCSKYSATIGVDAGVGVGDATNPLDIQQSFLQDGNAEYSSTSRILMIGKKKLSALDHKMRFLLSCLEIGDFNYDGLTGDSVAMASNTNSQGGFCVSKSRLLTSNTTTRTATLSNSNYNSITSIN